MSETVDIKRTIYGKNTFSSVVNTDFKELIPNQADQQPNPVATVDNFFDTYNTLFFEIPLEGQGSHRELLDRSGDYVGKTYTELLKEVEDLKAENVELKNKLDTLIG